MNLLTETSLAKEVARQLGSPVRLKTWSLIVTVFGDAILPRGGSVAAGTLGEIMEAMGVEAGAMRTAISRGFQPSRTRAVSASRMGAQRDVPARSSISSGSSLRWNSCGRYPS